MNEFDLRHPPSPLTPAWVSEARAWLDKEDFPAEDGMDAGLYCAILAAIRDGTTSFDSLRTGFLSTSGRKSTGIRARSR